MNLIPRGHFALCRDGLLAGCHATRFSRLNEHVDVDPQNNPVECCARTEHRRVWLADERAILEKQRTQSLAVRLPVFVCAGVERTIWFCRRLRVVAHHIQRIQSCFAVCCPIWTLAVASLASMEGYDVIATWCIGHRGRERSLFLATAGIAVIGCVAAYEAWIFGHRPSEFAFIDRYFWFVRIAGLALSGIVILAYSELAELDARFHLTLASSTCTPCIRIY